jgi:hypothetical protein
MESEANRQRRLDRKRSTRMIVDGAALRPDPAARRRLRIMVDLAELGLASAVSASGQVYVIGPEDAHAPAA